ncbi:hypothetical protein AURDEDRAFT_163014 [Auricularia subglabra TFB-10046 SS5]|nr:hypothetical protein AURDEDRAFT_163014 [Auricularia subglabra TFB-10046 SS5]
MRLDALDSADPRRTCAELDDASRLLARDPALRQELGANAALWSRLDDLWKSAAGDAQEDDPDDTDWTTLSLARFTRNIVAGEPANQQRAYAFEDRIRSILYTQTSYIALHDDAALPLTRMLVQALSNIITSNEPLLARFWNTNLIIPEERNILIRLLQADDEPTIQATLVLIYNCLHDSALRRQELVQTPGGKRVLVLLLDRTHHLFEREDESPAFKIAYDLFAHLFDNGQAPELWTALQPARRV